MASIDHISDSKAGSDALELRQRPKKNKSKNRKKETKKKKEEEENARELSMPGASLSHRFRESSQALKDEPPRTRSPNSEGKRIAVMIQGPSRPWEYQPYVAERTVDAVLAELDPKGGKMWYKIEYEDGRREDVSAGMFHIASYSVCMTVLPE